VVEIHKLTLGDALAVVADMGERDRHAIRAVMGAVGDEVIAANRWQTDGPAWVLIRDGAPVAIFGLAMYSGWSAVAWLISTPAMRSDSWRKLIRHCRTVLANMQASPLHRIEAQVMVGWPEAEAFAAHLGLTRESVRRKAGRHGEDVQIWTIVKE